MIVKLSKETVSLSLDLEKRLKDELDSISNLSYSWLNEALDLLIKDKELHYNCMKLVFDLFGDINRQFNKD